MKNKTFWILAAIVSLATVAFGIKGQTKTAEPVRWEYQTLYGAPAQLAGYNAYGQAGWELAAVSCQDNNNLCAFFFKRKK